MAADVRAGLDRSKLLDPGRIEVSLIGGVSHPWGGDTAAFVRGELGWHPLPPATLFAFGQVDTLGAQAGAGARWSW